MFDGTVFQVNNPNRLFLGAQLTGTEEQLERLLDIPFMMKFSLTAGASDSVAPVTPGYTRLPVSCP